MKTQVSIGVLATGIAAILLSALAWQNCVSAQAIDGTYYYRIGDMFWRRGDVRPDSFRRVYGWTPGIGSEQIVYESPYFLIRVRATKSERIAFMERRSEIYTVITVIDMAGEPRLEIRHEKSILDFVWNPRGTMIAYVAGERREMYPRGIDSSGVWIYYVDSGTSEKICDTGHAVSWPAFDDCVYIDVLPGREGHHVLRYHPAKRSLDSTELLGVDFSPDGKYYLFFSEATGYQVYRRERNSLIRELPGGADLTDILKRIGDGCRWLGKSTLYLPFAVPAEPVYKDYHVVLDLESGSMRESRKRPVDAWDDDAILVAETDGSLGLMQVSAMPHVEPQYIIDTIEVHPFLNPQ